MIRGTSKINGLALAEVNISLLRGRPLISVKAAFVDADTGATYGWTHAGADHGGPVWSAETIAAAVSLQDALERELADRHMTDATSTASAKPVDGGGLAEYFNEPQPG